MRPYAEIITNAREQLGLSDVEVAKAIGTNYDSYFDLEHQDDEIDYTWPMTEICKLLIVLRLDPYDFFAVPRELICVSENESPLALVQERLRIRIKWDNAQIEVPREDVKSQMGSLINNPNELADGPLDFIYDVARVTGIPSFSIFMEIFNKTKATFSYPGS